MHAISTTRLRARVLVVDPDIPFLNAVTRLLLEAGHEPRRANSLRHSLEKADGWVPDIVIVDRMLCVEERHALEELIGVTATGTGGLIVTDMAEEPVRPIALLAEVHRRLAA